MATATNSRIPREVVDFPANTPVPVALQYGQGKTISNQHGERMMYSLTDGRVMFLDLAVAGQIESAGINVRESFTITRKTDGPKGSPTTWEVARIPGEQPNGTLVLDAPDTRLRNRRHRPPLRRRNDAAQAGWQPLVDEANALVDSFAQVLERSLTLYQGRIKPDEVKALVVTAYIQRQSFRSSRSPSPHCGSGSWPAADSPDNPCSTDNHYAIGSSGPSTTVSPCAAPRLRLGRAAARRSVQSLDPDASVLHLRDRRPQRSSSHRQRRRHEHEGIRLRVRPFVFRLPHPSTKRVPPRGKRAFESRHGLSFACTVERLQREWYRKCA